MLDWLVPGSVWAIDHAEAPAPIDGLYPYLLAVRDLASGNQLLWLPQSSMDAEQTIAALSSLIARCGVPLVVKTDNGSAFCAEATQEFFHQRGVVCLLSPPGTPSYNGAVEAGIGSLKTRSERHATRQHRPGRWTHDDVEAARLEANATAQPKGPAGPTPDQAWAARSSISADQRSRFQATVARQRPQVRQEENYPTDGDLTTRDQRAIERIAIRRALVEHGYLLFRRRRLPLPIKRQKAAKI